MKKILFTLLALVVGFLPMMGQISEGEPHSSVIPRTGNRPQAGDWGIYIGGSVRQVMDLVNSHKSADMIFIGDEIDRAAQEGYNTKFNWWALPLLNLKYYITDQWEVRMGFEFASRTASNSYKYEFDDGDRTLKRNNRESQNFTRFLPGAAYHFNTKNLLDVYLGAQMPIGWDSYRSKSSTNDDGDKTYERKALTQFVIGGGVYIGLQAFIADLPLAIGVELGYSGVAKIGGHTKTTADYGDGKVVYYNDNEDLKKAISTQAEWGADAALTISYFFH